MSNLTSTARHVFSLARGRIGCCTANIFLRSNTTTFADRKPRVDLSRINKNRAKLQSILRAYDGDISSFVASSSVFNASLLDLPIRMGRPSKPGELPPRAIGNIELLKIVNFFHLTPRKIRKDAAALAPLCKEWPQRMQDRPIRITTRNYLYAGPSVSHPKSHIVELEVSLDDLPLDDEARERLITLAADCYDNKRNCLTILGDKCPTRKQNRDHIMYILTALLFESWK